MEMIGVLALVLFGLVFWGAIGGGNDAVDDDADGFWKPEMNEYIFVPGSVPHTMFMDDDD